MAQIKEVLLDATTAALQEVLVSRCLEIETEAARKIDISDWSQVEDKLNNLLVLLPTCSLMMQDAVLLYDTAKGLASDILITDERLYDAKLQIQIKWFEGKLARYNSVFVRTERCCKDLVNSIEGYRSILSFEKEQMRNKIFTT